MKGLKKVAFELLALLVLALSPLGAAWSQVQVTAATPSTTVQGTLSLDVTISGKGFNSSAAVRFLVNGSLIDTGGIVVRRVAVKGSTRLVATIDVPDTAVATKFDIEVALSDGRKGKGTTLFTVQAKTIIGACASATTPTFAFTTRTGKYLTPRVYIADRSGGCTRLVGSLTDGPYYYSKPKQFAFRLLKATTAGAPLTGRIAIQEQGRGVILMEFTVNPDIVGMQITSARQVALGFESGWGDLALSLDGTRLAVVDWLGGYPAPYTYRLRVVDLDSCLTDLANCTPETVYEETVASDGYAFASPRWGSNGYIYLEKRTGKLIDPEIVRVAADPPYSTTYERLVQPTGSRLALFDVQANGGDDVIAFAETPLAITSYCYKLKTALASTCSSSSCAIKDTGLPVSYYTSVEEVVGTTTRVLTLPLSKASCTPGNSIVRSEATDGLPGTLEPLISNGETPTSAN